MKFKEYIANTSRDVEILNIGNSAPFLEDLNGIEEFKNLTTLNINRGRITDLTPLKYLIHLKELHINHCNLNDISILKYFTNLQILSIESNKVSDISILSNLINLKYLDIQLNPIEDLTPIIKLDIEYIFVYRTEFYNKHYLTADDIRSIKGVKKILNFEMRKKKIDNLLKNGF